MNSFSSPFHSSVFRLVLQRAGSSWRAEGNLNWHTSSFLTSHPRRKKGASIIYISNQEPCKTGFHKTAFSSLLTSIRQISESNCQKWEKLYAAVYLQSGAVCMRRQDRIVLFFEDYSGIESPVESLEAPGPRLTGSF